MIMMTPLEFQLNLHFLFIAHYAHLDLLHYARTRILLRAFLKLFGFCDELFQDRKTRRAFCKYK
ncbi:hypothetical protein Hanom_Chr03g00269521 [Helianthus anomalus]